MDTCLPSLGFVATGSSGSWSLMDDVPFPWPQCSTDRPLKASALAAGRGKPEEQGWVEKPK